MEMKYDITISDNDWVTINGVSIQSKLHITESNVGHSICEAVMQYNKQLRADDGVYNVAVYWPVSVQNKIKSLMAKRYEIKPASHYYDKCELLRLPLGCYKTALYGEIIEAEIVNGEINKIITRLQDRRYKNTDICFAVMFKGDNTAFVKTVWTNTHYDNHLTIDKSKYIHR